MKFTKFITPIKISNSKEDRYIPSIFDKEFITYFYTHIFYSVFYEYIKVTKYQEFIGQFLNYTSPVKEMLVYHGLG